MERTRQSEGWSKSELRVHKDGIAALAAAVVKQWIEDGKPKADAEGIKPWLAILEERNAR